MKVVKRTNENSAMARIAKTQRVMADVEAAVRERDELKQTATKVGPKRLVT